MESREQGSRQPFVHSEGALTLVQNSIEGIRDVLPGGGVIQLSQDTVKKRVFLIEDDFEMAECYLELLSKAGYLVFSANSSEEALDALTNQPSMDLILVDYSLPQLSGVEFIREFKARFPQCDGRTSLVLFSGHTASSPFARSAEEAGAGFLEKPFDVNQFVDSVRVLIES